MSRLRRTADQPLSLFSFQDIVTSVTGIMVLLTLLLAVELIESIATAPPRQTNAQIRTSEASVDEMRAEAVALRQELQSLAPLPTDLPLADLPALLSEKESLQANIRRLTHEVVTLSSDLRKKENRLAVADREFAASSQQDEQELARLQKQIAQNRKELAEIESTNRMYLSKGSNAKAVWVIELAGPTPLAAELGVRAKPRQFTDKADLDQWIRRLNSHSTAFFIVVKPNGASHLDVYRDALRKAGFDVGFHVAADNQQIVDPTTGVGTP